MKFFIFLSALFITTPAMANNMMIYINPNRLCAGIVDIPYGSDNFSNEEWEAFKQCLDYVHQYENIE